MPGEKLQSEDGGSGAPQVEQVPPFDKKAAETARQAKQEEQERLEKMALERKKYAPETIEDPAKAYEMAVASDRPESDKAYFKRTAEEYRRKAQTAEPIFASSLTRQALELEGYAEIEDRDSKILAEDAARGYDEEKAEN